MKEPEQIDPAQTAGVNPSGNTAAKKRRNRSWDTAHNGEVATYRLPIELKAEIHELADSLGLSPGDVAKAFLEYGINGYKNGKLKLVMHTKNYPGK
jgi:hypothetical protein